MTPTASQSITKIIQDFIGAMSDAGMPFDGTIHDDGELHRFQVTSDKRGSLNGWYVFHSDGVPSGAFGSWKTGATSTWCSKSPTELNEEERKAQQARIRAAKLKRTNAIKAQHAEAAMKAVEIWNYSDVCTDHPYLDRKQCQAHGLRVLNRDVEFRPSYDDKSHRYTKGSLIIPMCDEGKILSLQFITPHKPDIGPDKRFLKGGQKKGTYFGIKPENGIGDVIYICEGYATGATIFAVMNEAVAIAWDSGNLPEVAKAFRQTYPKKKIIIAADNDQWTTEPVKNPGLTKANTAAAQIKGGGNSAVVFPRFNDLTGRPTDFNDLYVREGAEACRKYLTPEETPQVQQLEGVDSTIIYPNIPGLTLKSDETPHTHLSNAIAILKHDARWRYRLKFNDFSKETEAVDDLPFEHGHPGPWSDYYDSKTAAWLAMECGLRLNTKVVAEAVATAAQDFPFHPIRDYLEGLQWDGISRLDDWLNDFLGVQDKTAYTQAVGRCFLIASVARIFEPGCKHDVALILEGDQGKGKSTVVSVLGGKYTLDTPIDLGSNDGYAAIQGMWFVELPELDSLSRSSVKRIKAFFSSSRDTYRQPYARRPSTIPRQCVFIGTVNNNEYLEDETGNRRFWPIKIGDIDIKGLIAARDQLFAEAVVRYRNGEPWHLTNAEAITEATDQQQERISSDLWDEMIYNWIADQGPIEGAEFRAYDLLTKACFIDPDSIDNKRQARLGKRMARLGYQKYRKRVPNGGYINVYRKVRN